MKISVLTATYNRKELLKNLYDSLLKNVNDGIEIEWLIMDDGSNDGTTERIEEWKKENKIEIKNERQENQGKMVAINHLVEKATGDLMVDCDSDDYFTENAFQIIKEVYEKNKEKKGIYGFCFLKYDTKGTNMGNDFKKQETTMFDLYFKEGETGEKAIVFFSKIRKKYQHQLEKKERFITEARLFHKMDESNKMLCINQPIMICEYQEEGYTNNIRKQFEENPFGYYAYFQEILQKDFQGVVFSKRWYAIKHFILFSYLTKQYQIKTIRGLQNKLWYVIFFIPGILKSRLKFNRKLEFRN